MASKPRLIKVSELVTPTVMVEGSLEGQPGDGGSEVTVEQRGLQSRGRPSMGMLGRLSLGGAKKKIVADVFAIEPSPRPNFRRQSSGVSAPSVPLGSTSSLRRGRNGDDVVEEDIVQRHALFGDRNVVGGSTSGSATRTDRVAGGLSGTHEALSEAHDLAIERGEKLASMADKSRQLEDSAIAFGDIAKQLRRQQQEDECCVS